GAQQPRDLAVPGRDLTGIYFAMEFLQQQNRRDEGESVAEAASITATGKHVVIIGGGDTGADCLGTAHRQKALSVRQLELLPEPPRERSPQTPWPMWPMQLRVESSHEEGGTREWSVSTISFSGDEQRNVKTLKGVRGGPPPGFEPVVGSEFAIADDLVLLALGFVGAIRSGMIVELGVKLEPRGNLATDENSMTSVQGVFAAGDMRRGQSLVVWAIAEGRRAAQNIDRYLREQSGTSKTQSTVTSLTNAAD